ncbi:hypothetical protein FQA39_LY12088 [Lamprigera yunnana]|nr:hypothetical protein FQA39_LY12088 [Lamprigera yunnana]
MSNLDESDQDIVAVLPGRSVSVADFESRENEESEIDDNVAPLSLESDSEDGQEELMEPETENEGQEQKLNGYDDPKFTLPTLEDISIDDFLEIKLEVEPDHKSKKAEKKKCFKFFIGISNEKILVSFLRQNNKIQNAFKFPDIDDTSEIELSQINNKLPNPTMLRRKGFQFNMNMNLKSYVPTTPF